jgi:hypothetical protein
MPDDTQEKHTPGPWHVVPRPWDEKGCTVDTTEDSHIAKLIFSTPLADFLGRDEHSLETMRANARLIAAAPNLLAACKALTKAVPPEENGAASHRQAVRASRAAHRAIAKAHGLDDPSDSGLPDRDERDAVGLTSAGKEVADLRDENERLKERVAELEETCETVLKWVAHDFKSGLPTPEGTPDAGEAERILRDALPGENAPHDAEVIQ